MLLGPPLSASMHRTGPSRQEASRIFEEVAAVLDVSSTPANAEGRLQRNAAFCTWLIHSNCARIMENRKAHHLSSPATFVWSLLVSIAIQCCIHEAPSYCLCAVHGGSLLAVHVLAFMRPILAVNEAPPHCLCAAFKRHPLTAHVLPHEAPSHRWPHFTGGDTPAQTVTSDVPSLRMLSYLVSACLCKSEALKSTPAFALQAPLTCSPLLRMMSYLVSTCLCESVALVYSLSIRRNETNYKIYL
eukprot:scaffold187026_cov22-Tisochrysis_lutea.AAC.1